MRCYLTTGQEGPRLRRSETELRSPGHREVVVSLRAVSLNYRDLVISQRFSNVVPVSDGAGTVSALGDGVQDVAIGDRVVIGFMPGWIEGEFTEARKGTSLGGPGMDGVLAERIIVPSNALVRIPDAMTFE